MLIEIVFDDGSETLEFVWDGSSFTGILKTDSNTDVVNAFRPLGEERWRTFPDRAAALRHLNLKPF